MFPAELTLMCSQASNWATAQEHWDSLQQFYPLQGALKGLRKGKEDGADSFSQEDF